MAEEESDTPGLARPELVRVLEYKGLDARWTDWKNVTEVCRSVALEMVQ
jgi:hypothetical protein